MSKQFHNVTQQKLKQNFRYPCLAGTEHGDAGVWDKGLAAGSVVGSCWEMLEDTCQFSSDSPNK